MDEVDQTGQWYQFLSPIDLEELLTILKLTTGKAAECCDNSRRQLCDWTDKEIVDTVEGDEEEYGEKGARRVYDFTALRRVLLIKQLLEQGRGLKRATLEVESYLVQFQENGLKPDTDCRTREEALQQQTERLEGLAEQVRSAVHCGRVNQDDLKQMSRDTHAFLELKAYEESAILHLQEDVSAANQLRSMIDQLSLHVEDKVMEGPPGARRIVR